MGGDCLDGIPLFDALAAEDRDRAAAVSRQLRWEPGHVALREGEFAFDFYAIKHGAVEIQRAGEQLATLGAGEFFGEIGLARDGARHASRRRSATVVVTAPTEVIAIPGSEMKELTREIPALREALNRAAEDRGQA